jgi:hypothetical protein
MRFLIFLLFSIFVVDIANAQSCNPASVYYLVRDEKGQLLTREQLKVLVEQLPKRIGDASVGDNEVSFKPDKVTYYWPEDADSDKGSKVPALLLSNAGECTMKLGEVTLTLNGKKMRLVFNINIDRTQNDRRQVVDSLRFQEGTFNLDLTKWDRSPEKLIPATHWKRAE